MERYKRSYSEMPRDQRIRRAQAYIKKHYMLVTPQTPSRLKPEEIPKQYREAYERVRILSDGLRTLKNPAIIEGICSNAGFSPDRMLHFFNQRRMFSEKQINFINNLYNRFETYRDANKMYDESGHRAKFKRLMQDVIKASKNTKKPLVRGQFKAKLTLFPIGDTSYGRYFGYVRGALPLVPKAQRPAFAKRVDALEKKYMDFYYTAKAKRFPSQDPTKQSL